ncbi:MAG: glycoside hydrolase family 13 protein [Clostridium sp.]
MVQGHVYHNSHLEEYRKPFGAVEVGTDVTLSILAYKEMKVNLYVINFEGKVSKFPMTRVEVTGEEALFQKTINTHDLLGVVNYYFSLEKDFNTIYYGNNEGRFGGEGQLYRNNPVPYQITIHQKQYVPSWYKEGIIYQVFVDRFYNGNEDGSITCPKKNSFIYGNWNDDPMYIRNLNGAIERWDFYGGNLKGVIKKLDYIKDLGANIIYFNPIFEAASCHKYDTGDYEKIDKMFGTEDDFKLLCDEAHKRGMKIILDGVFSHTGADSKYFNKFGNYNEVGAYQSKDSKYYNWYRFWGYPDRYECWWGIDNQPNVDELNEEYLDYIVRGENSVIKKWMRLGADGWRLDVADELPDKFIKILKDEIRKINSESILIGEVWEDASNKISYSKKRKYFLGEELDSVTNYPLKNIIIKLINEEIKLEEFIKILSSIKENYPKDNFYGCMNLLGNHDTERIYTVLGEDVDKLTLAVFLQMILPGVPLIYYGDEVGLLGGKDPSNRKSFPWGDENKEVMNTYKKFISIRNEEVALKSGDFKIIGTSNEILIIERQSKGEIITAVINFSNQDQDSFIPCSMCNGVYSDLLSDTSLSFNECRRIRIKSKKFKLFKNLIKKNI